MKRRGRIALAALLALGLGCGVGDHMIGGLGNGGNHIYTDPMEALAEILGRSPSVPPVTDEMLVEGFDAIRRRAAGGDPEAVLILYRVADQQRKDAD